MRYTKDEAVRIAVRCGKEYKEKLAETKVLFIYRDKIDNNVKYIEVGFRPHNYQHLTGLLLADEDGKVIDNCSLKFYHKCTAKKSTLSASEIKFKEDGTTPLKLHALPYIIDITKITKICGNYNNSKPSIKADALVGSVNFSLALSKNGNSDDFFPRSGLLEDIRQLTTEASRVIAIYQKELNSTDKYTNLKYRAKGVDLTRLTLSDEIINLINIH